MGMHNYAGADLWQNLNLPSGFDRDTFIDECLLKGSEFSLLYPDLDFMEYMIGHWSRKWYHNFERWLKAEQEEYNALYNLDVDSFIDEVGHNIGKDNKSIYATGSGNGSSSAHEGGTETNRHDRAAYDSATFQPTELDTRTPDITQTSSTATFNSSNSKEEGSNNSQHDVSTHERRYGNQGVTMSQEMLLAEYNVRLYNLYEKMAEIFINEFCICIYQ
jgi:hypothetical protein